MTEDELRRRRAYHEAGHAVLAVVLEMELQGIYLGERGGVAPVDQDLPGPSREDQARARRYVQMLLGGDAAEVHFFGTAIGSIKDRREARQLCFGARIGTWYFNEGLAQAQRLAQEWSAVIEAAAEEALAVEVVVEHPDVEIDNPEQYGLPIRKLSGDRVVALVDQARPKRRRT